MQLKKLFAPGSIRGLLIFTVLLLVAVVLGLSAPGGAAADAPAVQIPSPASASDPIIIEAERADLSPPLRSMEVIEPDASGPIREMPWRPSQQGASQSAADGIDTVVQGSHAPAVIPSPIVNFEGVSNVNGVLPPDPNGDVGPNHYVQMVNISFAIWDKTGALLFGPVNNNTLWAGFGGPCEVDNSGDPIVLYDHLADRWILSQFAVGTGAHECIAVSQTPDPLGAYYRYGFNIGGFPDYPKLGVWPDSYLATFRNFGAVFDMQAAAFNRAKMLTGDPTAEMVIFSMSTPFGDVGVDGFLPADLDGPAPPAGTPALFLGTIADEFGHDLDQIAMFELDVDWSNIPGATFTGPLLLPTAPFDPMMCDGNRDCIPQPGTSQGLDAISDRPLFRLVYRDYGFYEVLVATQTVDVGGDHAGKRWYELRNTGNGWGIYQQGTYAPDSDHRWMGAIAMDAAGNIGLGYTVSSDTVFPSIRYTGRLVTDPLGQMPQGEGLIIAGGGSQTHPAARWGDYSSMSIDPVDDCTFWYTNEYIPTTGSAPWQTRIASFKFAECPMPAMDDFSLWGLPRQQSVCAPDPAAFDVSVFEIGSFGDPVTLSASSLPPGYSAAFTSNPVNAPANTVMNVTNTGASATGSYDILITGDAPAVTHVTTVTLDVFTDVPTAPAPLSPVDGALNQSLRPVLDWTTPGVATSYFVEVATDMAFSSIVYTDTVPGPPLQVGVDLAPDTTYYWRVSALNTCGAGPTSAVFSFTTIGSQVVCRPGYDLSIAYSEPFTATTTGWTHDAPIGSDTWMLTVPTDPSPASGGFAFFSQDLGQPANQRLTSPAITLPDASPLDQELFLEFYNEQNFENPAGSGGCWDGGLLEISTDGGTTWDQLDAELLSDPYDGFGNNGPPAGLHIWCGTTGGFQPWTNSIVDMNGYAGQTVQFRFRNVSDAAASAEGWYIDDVTISTCVAQPAPGIVVTKTVGIDPAVCASTSTLVVGQPNTDVTYCYQVENTGDITLTTHDVVDDKLGVLASGLMLDLAPGDTYWFTATTNITGPVTNVVNWTASVPGGPSAMASATAMVTEQPTNVSLTGFGDGASAALDPLWLVAAMTAVLGLGFLLRRRFAR